MDRFLRGAAALLVFIPSLGLSQDNVAVRALAQDRHELEITLAETSDPAHGQQALLPKAQELCGDRHPRFGKYRFEAREPMAGASGNDTRPSLRFIQEIACADSPEDTTVLAARAPPAPRTPPTAEEDARVRKATLDYLAAKDTGDFDRAQASIAASAAEFMGQDEWRQPRAAFNAAAGDRAEREVIRLTWYDDPAGAPTPGRYVAADYRARFPSQAFYCGYVMWLRQHDGNYLIVREEEGIATPETVAGIPEGNLAEMRAALGCRD